MAQVGEIDLKVVSLQVMTIIDPSIQALFYRYTKRKELQLVVMDPTKKPWECSFEEAILFEHSFGGPWEHDYRSIARSKARVAWREGRSNVEVNALGPAVLRPGDTVHSGSFVYQEMVAAASGVEPYFDALISGWFVITFQQLMQHHIQQYRAANKEADFLP